MLEFGARLSFRVSCSKFSHSYYLLLVLVIGYVPHCWCFSYTIVVRAMQSERLYKESECVEHASFVLFLNLYAIVPDLVEINNSFHRLSP